MFYAQSTITVISGREREREIVVGFFKYDNAHILNVTALCSSEERRRYLLFQSVVVLGKKDYL